MAFECTDLDDLLIRYYLTTMYSLEFCLGFLGNLVVILAYIFCLKEWKSINVYLFNLTVSDLVFLCSLPRLVQNYAFHGGNETSSYICISNRFILHLNLYSSILFMMWVSVDRYLLLEYPLRQHILLKKTTAIWVSILTWIIISVQICPLVYFVTQDKERSNFTETCKDFASLSGNWDNLTYSLVLTVTGYILPLLAMCFTSWRFTLFLKAQEGIFGDRSGCYQKPVQVVAAAATMFFMLYTPYHVMRNVRIASKLWPDFPLCSIVYIESVYIVTRPIAFAHSVINPVFYFLIGDNFRELLLSKLKMLSRRSASQSMGYSM